MKYKKILLIVFLLMLFVFQQAQAGAIMPPKENPSQVSFAPPHAPLPTINVFVLWLTTDGTNAIDYSNNNQPYKCDYPRQHHGCGVIDLNNQTPPEILYPFLLTCIFKTCWLLK
jgi:hypothetical protein